MWEPLVIPRPIPVLVIISHDIHQFIVIIAHSISIMALLVTSSSITVTIAQLWTQNNSTNFIQFLRWNPHDKCNFLISIPKGHRCQVQPRDQRKTWPHRLRRSRQRRRPQQRMLPRAPPWSWRCRRRRRRRVRQSRWRSWWSRRRQHWIGESDPNSFETGSERLLTHRIHGAAIYGNMDPINIPPMLAYMVPMGKIFQWIKPDLRGSDRIGMWSNMIEV